jgi:hypothetical protein
VCDCVCGVGGVWGGGGGRRRALPADSHSCCAGGLPPSIQLYCKQAMRHAHAGMASSLATTTTRVLSSSSMAWSSPFDRWVHLGVGACPHAPYGCLLFSPFVFTFFLLSLGDNVLTDQNACWFLFHSRCSGSLFRGLGLLYRQRMDLFHETCHCCIHQLVAFQ